MKAVDTRENGKAGNADDSAAERSVFRAVPVFPEETYRVHWWCSIAAKRPLTIKTHYVVADIAFEVYKKNQGALPWGLNAW
jgi:hypothetical protein